MIQVFDLIYNNLHAGLIGRHSESATGTFIRITNLRRTHDGQLELDFSTDQVHKDPCRIP